MKCYLKATLVLILSVCSSENLEAQTNSYNKNDFDDRVFKISFGAEIGITSKSSPFNYGLGFDLHAQYYLSSHLAIIASGGYARLLTKDTSLLPDYDFIPIISGVRIFPIEKIYLIGNGGLGVPIQNGSKTSFIFGGGLGYEYNRYLDFQVKYTGYQQPKSSSTYQPTNGLFAVRLGYNF